MYLMVFFVLVLEGLGGWAYGWVWGRECHTIRSEQNYMYQFPMATMISIMSSVLICGFDMCISRNSRLLVILVTADLLLFRANWGRYHYKTQNIGHVPNLIRLRMVLPREEILLGIAGLEGLHGYVTTLYPRFLPDDHNICRCITQSHHISHFVTSITTSMSGRDCGRECQTRRIAAAPHGKTSPCYPE